ncbi:MAG: DUF1847 domain-containing protein [Candidatus Bathyarchaeota archaeon]|nr:DUF1847 domain-containing protein [Candidatus Bathyarchaeota archaeon]MDW8040486.1 DUF1847 domain-containing protein [Nitrososphaerota archaeon]
MKVYPQCAECSSFHCSRVPLEKIDDTVLPSFCPMKNMKETIQSAITKYGEDHVKRIYVPATITEKKAYQVVRGVLMGVLPRIKELIEFAKLVDAKKLGLAFCVGLRDEAARTVAFLKEAGFTVASVCCKCGAVDKTELGAAEDHKIGAAFQFEAACNPIVQAQLLNEAETEINVIVGLCVGHDMLFTIHSKAPVTTLIVKDRLLGHNPVAALYSNYHKHVVKS